jgi:hypothetical protein
MLIGAVAAFSVDIWSVVDAIRVTKVNNLAWRDKNSSSYNFQIQPYIFYADQYSNTNPKVGLSVKLNF